MRVNISNGLIDTTRWNNLDRNNFGKWNNLITIRDMQHSPEHVRYSSNTPLTSIN